MGIYLCDERNYGEFDELHRQNAVLRSAPMRLRNDPRLRVVVEDAAFTYKAMAAITIINWRKQMILASAGVSMAMMDREDAICDVTIQRPGEPLIVADARTDPRFSRRGSVLAQPFARFYAGVSINDGAGYALGALCVFDVAPRASRVDAFALTVLARQAEGVICL